MSNNDLVLTSKNIGEYYKGEKRFIVPGECIGIGEGTFRNCKELETIEFPDELEVIAPCTFENCLLLKSITLPPKIKFIRGYTFENCRLLEKVILPQNLEGIYNFAFLNCTSLTEITIPDNVSSIEERAFKGCRKLRKVVLPKNLNWFGSGVFLDCPLKSLTVHACYQKQGFGHTFLRHIFNVRDNYNIPKFDLIIKYDNYKELYQFVKIITKNNTLRDALNGWCTFNIVFDGEKLNFFEQLSLKRLITKHYITKINLFFGVQAKDDKEEKLAIEEYNPQNNLSDEIKKLLEEINTLSSKLPEEVKNSLNQKISKLISDYEKGMQEKNKRPTLSLDDEKISLEVETMDPETILLISLTQIKLDFSSYDRLLKEIASVYKCNELLKSKVDKRPEEVNNVEEIIQAIVYLINKIDERKAKYFITKVETTLNDTLNKYNKDLDNLFGNNDTLLLLESPLTNQQLKIDLLKILDELTIYTKKVIPYLEILKVLNTKEVTIYEEDDSIANTIIGMKYVSLFIINERYQKQIEQEITSFCNEYITKIESIIANIDNKKEIDYHNLEDEMRKKIHPILEKLNLYISKDENEKDLLTQLQNCISILNSTEPIEINKNKLIESWIGEIHNILMTNEQILDEEKQEIDKKLLVIINNWIEKFDEMSEDEDMFMVMQSISSDIAEVYIKVSSFIKGLNDFDKINYNIIISK